MPTAARQPTASAPENPSKVAPTVRIPFEKYQNGALAISEKMALGAGRRYSGGLSSTTAACHRTKNPTTTRLTWMVRSADDDGSFVDMSSPQHAETLEDGPDPGSVPGEILRLANRKPGRPRELTR